MNRIRRVGDNYQVLITPHTFNSSSFETLFDHWLDECFGGSYILHFHNLQEAQCEAFKHPDIDWYKMYLSHIELHKKFNNLVRDIIEMNNFTVEIEDRLLQPEEIKNSMFDRVLSDGDNFSLTYTMSDIIGFHIVNPWTANLESLYKVLKNDHRLNIIKIFRNDKLIHLIGRTDVGTTYEIKLWPSLLFNWAKWVSNNSHNPRIDALSKKYHKRAVYVQDNIDNAFCLR